MKAKTVNVKNLKLQYYIGVFLFIVTTLFFTSCSSNKYSQSDVDMYLKKERVKAKTSPIAFRIPQGWHVVNANNEEFVDLLIVRNDMNVSLSLQPFYSNSNLLLKNCFEESILMQQAKFKNRLEIIKEKPITLNNTEVLFYHFSSDKKQFRVALFLFKGKAYELTLFGNNTNIKIEYFIQELVISSTK